MLEFKQFLPYLPFLSAAIVGKEINTGNIISRLIEVSIIGGVILYASVQVLDTRFGHLEKELAQCTATDIENKNEIRSNVITLNTILIQLENLRYKVEDNKNILNEFIKRSQI